MSAECNSQPLLFHDFGPRVVTARFDGGDITSDGGMTLVGATDERLGLLERAASCFVDHRDPGRVQHSVLELLRQRVFGLALGYEDLVDHDELRRDRLLAAVVGKRDVGEELLAGKSTLNRMELTLGEVSENERYKKIALDTDALDRVLVEAFLDAYDEPPGWIELDLDNTDVPLHGHQEGRFFHGYYGHYCYLPLYIFSGEHLLLARLGTADRDGAAGATEEIARIVAQIRERWPQTEILVRGDSGFCREELMAWCEENDVWYVVGMAKNARLRALIAEELAEARLLCELSGRPERVFAELEYTTLESWGATRRVVAKAEHLVGDKSNPRFVVTNIPADVYGAQMLYEDVYCIRGEMENRIKEQQLYLFADRASAATMRANQIRLYLSSLAYVLLSAMRRLALAGTELARAQCHTIRTKLLKIGAVIRVTTRRVWVSMSSAYPYQQLFALIHARLTQPRAGP